MSRPDTSDRSDPQLARTRRDLKRLPFGARALTWPVVAIVLIHTLMIGLWVAPNNPARDSLGADRVREYVQPWFSQNWSIFAPNPRRVAVTFEVRATVRDPETGDEQTTDWVDLIDNEDGIVAGNPFPARTAKITRRTTDRLHSAISGMSTEQREWLEANYVETPVDQLRERLAEADGGAGTADINRYMTADAAATAIATGFAENEWGDEAEILYIQYRTSTRPAPSWDSDSTIDDTTRTERDYGWRSAVELTDQQIEHFGPYLEQGGDWR
ncbi:DUF5819 family protein [Nesterenkonia sp. HG001]|uniref:DUF5819 family protein n=1 Tax=Nesterenkonia sp. HG001 TaxID=2983207 RepID=UPI002AC7402A|nr:DUF5819 family protein [Nesterenkonia sp. HG001]MDZ5077442.1 DUF5819 family protein [Nesterenkonia sp. HG001]